MVCAKRGDSGRENEHEPDCHASLPVEFDSRKSHTIYNSSDAAASFLIACGLSIDFGDFGGDKADNSDGMAPDEPEEQSDSTAKEISAEDKTALEKITSPTVSFQSATPGGQTVTARQLTEDFKVKQSAGAIKEFHRGDWFVTDSSGNHHVVPRDQFLKDFKPAPLRDAAPVQKFIKTLPIQAELITKDTQWHNPDAAPGSPPESAKAGDYLAKPNGQAPYVIPKDYFKANYVQIPGSGEFARTSITKAQLMTKQGSIWSTNSGVTSGEPGDYLITRDEGTQEILSAKKFHEQFTHAEEAPINRKPLSKPRATSKRFDLDAAKGITAERWEKGLIIYDDKSVTITDDTTGSSKEYVEGRLARERGTTVNGSNGERVINRTYTYGDLANVRQLPSLDSYRDLLERRPELKRAQELSDTMPMTHHDSSPERLALRAKLSEELTKHINELCTTPANDSTTSMKIDRGKKLNIVLGLSGSGKSTIANEIAANNHAYIADVDDIKRKLPEWQGGIGAAATAVEAHLINNPLVAEQLAHGNNLVIPVVGANTGHIEKLMESAKKQGYEISLTLVDVPPTEAMKRIVARLENGGLYVDPNYLSSLGNRPSANFRELIEKYFVHGDTVSHFAQVSNFGKTPVLVAEGHLRGAADTSGLGRREFFAEANVNVGENETLRRSQMPDTVKDQAKLVEGPVESKPLSNAGNPQVGEKPIYAAPPNDSKSDSLLPNVELVKSNDLAKSTDERQFRDAVKDLIKQAKEGKSVSFEIDTKVTMTGADSKPIKSTQAGILYDELKIAYPERAFMFTKPDLKPGDKGYTELPAPKVATDGLEISTMENAITLVKELELADGKKVPPGSTLAVGTTYDGKQFQSASPDSKVWAVTPEGNYVQLAEAGEGFAATPDTISNESSKRGEIVNKHQPGISPVSGQPYENHLIVRTTSEKSPDGKPLLDVYPIGGPSFETLYKPGSKDGFYSTKAKAAAHFLLPENITVHAETKYGHMKATGSDGTYFMDNGYGDAKDATAKNYVGETDPRSAKEVMRIRAELGMTDATPVEAGLVRSQSTPNDREKLPETFSEIKELANKTGSFATAQKCVEWLNTKRPEGFANTLFELAKGDSRAAIPALQALADRPESVTEARQLVNDRWNSGDLLSMLKENKIDPKGLQNLVANEKIVAPNIWKEAWIGSADSPDTRERLAHLFLESSESEGSCRWSVEIADELRRGAIDFVIENRLPRFEKSLQGATKMEHGISEHAKLMLRSLQDLSDQRPKDINERKSTGVIDLKEHAEKTTIADAERAIELRQSNVVHKVLKESGMDEVRAKELERKLTSMDEKERESAIKEIDKHFEEKVVAAESGDGAKPGKEGKTNEENRLRGFDKFKSKLSEHKGKLATVVVLTAPIAAGMMMRQETNKASSPGSTFSK